MSSKRKITVSSNSSSSRRSRSSERDEFQGNYHQSQQSLQQPPRQRPSVFSRLGTKRSPAAPLPPGSSSKPRVGDPIQCRNILETGVCKFESKCKYANTHKMALQTRSDSGGQTRSKLRGPTNLKRTNSPSVDADWTNWNEESLDYEDEKMLEKKR